MHFQKLKKERIEEIIETLRHSRITKYKTCNEQLQTSLKKEYASCRNKICPKYKSKVGVWANTPFRCCNIKKEEVLEIIELWLQKASLNLISYILRIDRKTVWRVLKKVSRVLVPRHYNAAEVIVGDDTVVEIDESKFGKRKYNRGHHVDGVWILGAVERTGLRRIRITAVDDRTLNTLTSKIKECVKEDSMTYTDCWKGYNCLSNVHNSHATGNHSKHFKDPETGVHINTIEGCWFGIKMHIPPKLRTKDNLNLYLVHYMILRNE